MKVELANLPPALRGSGLAKVAMAVADRLDVAATRDTASLARELRATLAELRLMAAGAPEGTDVVDDLLARRRRGGGFPPQRGAPRD